LRVYERELKRIWPPISTENGNMKNMVIVAVLLAVSTAVCAAQGLAPTKPADIVAPTEAELAATNRKQAPAETKQKKDCVIVAAEAYKRLQAQGIWAEVVGFYWNWPDGRKSGHAVCIFQLSKTGNILVYDGWGTNDLKVKSADLQVIEQAYNRLIAYSGYTVSGFEVLVQEPRKANPPEGVLSTQEPTKARAADSQPHPQPSKPTARTATRSRTDSRPASPQQQMSRTESLLLRSGFKANKVKTAKVQRAVNELPQGKISYMNYNGQLYYVYPAATRDKVYVGTQAQFNAFAGIRSPVPNSKPQGLGPQTVGPPMSYPFNPLPPTPPDLR
jgi:hypothetical protein